MTISDKDIASLLERADHLLTGEPARLIGYGATAVVCGVVLISNALGFTKFGSVDPVTAFGVVTAALTTVVTVIESIRRSVYSPNTVVGIAEASAVQGVPIVPAPPSSSEDLK